MLAAKRSLASVGMTAAECRTPEEYGWDETFEALVARIVADFIQNR